MADPMVAAVRSGVAGAPAVEVEDVRKTYGHTAALDGVSLSIQPGQIHALMGGNGSGKSTLIKVIAGVVKADAGRIQMHGQWSDLRSQSPARAKAGGLHFVHQQSSTFADMTVAENLALGRGFETRGFGLISWRGQTAWARRVLERFEIRASPTDPLSALGPATRMMIAIARALQDQEDSGQRSVLVLDEPTASLPPHEVEVLLDALRGYAAGGQTIVYVSHRIPEVVQLAHAATVLRNGTVAARLDGAEVNHRALVVAITGQDEQRAVAAAAPARSRASSVLEVAGPGISLSIGAGEVVGLAGLLGSGRSRLLKQIFGVLSRPAVDVTVDGHLVPPGDVRAAMKLGVAHLPEDRLAEAAFLDLSIASNLSIVRLDALSRLGFIPPTPELQRAETQVRRFAVKADSAKSLLSSLSGGNQQKVVLARWLQRDPKVLLLDEPTQGVDVSARAEIHHLIAAAAERGAAVVVASSDFDELARISHRVVVIKRGRTVADRTGPLTEGLINDTVYSRELT